MLWIKKEGIAHASVGMLRIIGGSMDLSKMTEPEIQKLNDFARRRNQLRNFNMVLNQPLPPKKRKELEALLPGYIMRNKNAEEEALPVMKRYNLA